MDQKFCLVYNDRVVTPKSYKYKYEGKVYFFLEQFGYPEVLPETRFLLIQIQAAKREVASLTSSPREATSANSDN